MACDGMRWHATASVGIRWHTTASVDIRWHATASVGIRLHTTASDGLRWHAIASSRTQSHTVALVSDSEDEAEHLDDAPRYHANHREDGMRHCIEQHEEKAKYHHSTHDFRFNLGPLQRPDSTYKVTKNF